MTKYHSIGVAGTEFGDKNEIQIDSLLILKQNSKISFSLTVGTKQRNWFLLQKTDFRITYL
jgi:hypothetical protein